MRKTEAPFFIPTIKEDDTMRKMLISENVFDGEKYIGAAGIVVEDNRITGVVPHDTDSTGMEIMDFGKALLMPGFIDAHTHFFSGAESMSRYMCTNVREAKSEKECVAMMKEFAEANPELEILRGEGWFIGNWTDRTMPDKRSLDEAFPDKPVYMRCADGHSYWINSAALKQCGIDENTKPASGYVGKYDNGEPNGMLIEPEAYKPADDIYYNFSREEQQEIYENFFRITAGYGITGLGEMFAENYTKQTKARYELMKKMDEEGKVKARIYIYTKLFDYTDFQKAKEWQKEFDTENVRIGGVKGFVDGVAENYTALMLKPYSDRPETSGDAVPLRTYEEIEKSVRAANEAGLQVRLHCIGDGAVRMALDIYEEAGCMDCNTIEHIESIDPEDIKRFKQIGVIPSMQPEHLVLDNNNKIIRIGEDRVRYEWPLKTMYEATERLAIGTDFPVVGIDPFRTIYSAVTRCDHEGRPTGCNPDERLTMEQVLTGYTKNAAAAYNSKTTGMLKAGMSADIIAIDRNLFDTEPEEILKSKVIFTMFEGKQIY